MSTLTGTGTLVRFFLRRDRWAVLAWAAGAMLLYVSQAAQIDQMYKTRAGLAEAAEAMGGNAAFIAMLGPARALDTIGGQVAWQVGAYGAIVAGLMSMFLVGRHTRAEEESGRDELVRSAAVGRHAPVAATLVVVTLANALLGAAVGGSLVGYGLPTAGSWALGVAAATAGLVFAAIALVAAQVFEGARSVYGVTGAAIGAAYVLRAIGDVGDGFASWLSPIGWGQAMRAYAGEVWWPALLSVGAAAAVTAVALRLLDHRDIGRGLFASRPGRTRARRGLAGTFGLAWRLQRGALVGWAAGLFLTGLAYGSIGSDIDDLLAGSTEATRQMMAQSGGSLVDSFYATAVLMLALISAAYAVQAGLRLSGEEAAGRVESLLATGLSRARWVAGHVGVALAGVTVVVMLGGFGTGVAYALVSGDGSQVGRLLGAALAYLPAVWVLVAVTVALFGLFGRWALLGWLALTFCVLVMLFGQLLDLPGWLVDVSPFSHIPMLPVADLTFAPLAVVTVIAAALLAVGFAGFARRDVRTS